MTRLTTNFSPTAEATKTLDDIKSSMGMVPNIFKIMAQAPNVLEGYLSFNTALSKGSLTAKDREQISLAVAGYDHCTYCASAHTMLAQKAGVNTDETKLNLKAKSTDTRTEALLKFCVSILQNKGNVTESDMQVIRAAEFSDAQIVEIVAVVCANIFTNYFNHVAGTEVDFPKVSLD
jgi:uncharacterized peroxidase-related enzyme